MKRTRLADRFAVYAALFLAVIMAANCYFGILRETRRIMDQMRKDGVALAQAYALAIENSIVTDSGISRIVEQARASRGLSYMRIHGQKGRFLTWADLLEDPSSPDMDVFSEWDAPADDPMLATVMQTGRPQDTIHSVPDGARVYRVMVPIYLFRSMVGAVELGMDMTNVVQAVRQATVQAALMTMGALALGIAGIYILATTVTKPIGEMTEASHRIASGDFSTRIRVNTGDELEALAGHFNSMAASLAVYSEQQKEAYRVRRLAELGQISASIAHEVRNPLGSIISCARYIQSKAAQPETAELTAIMIKESERLNALVRQLLEFAQPRQAEVAYTDPSLVLADTVRLIELRAASEGIGVEFSRSEVPMSFLDPDRLHQAFLNVGLNAIDAIVEWRRTGDPALPVGQDVISVKICHDQQRAAIAIAFDDTGPGISRENLERVFEPLYTTRSRGTGLGLAIVRQVVEEHGGTIRAQSPLANGRGARFEILLPVRSGGGAEVGLP
ncbi:MAG: ATP-binding protein [Clostridia bacterium]|nr:ATP-binding protein [Clostridia bacterium]